MGPGGTPYGTVARWGPECYIWGMDKIILHIPHSTPCTDFSAWSNQEAVRNEHDKWTDWHTDTIFKCTDRSLEPRVATIVFPVSRYTLDVERYIGDPMEQCGQGAIYTRTKDGSSERKVEPGMAVRLTAMYANHWATVASMCQGKGLLIDCHSFPTDHSAPNSSGGDFDVCIGYNDDGTYPGDGVIETIAGHFRDAGYSVGINEPFSNSFAPVPDFPSVMIELRKGIYMDEGTRELLSSAYKVNQLLNRIYGELLG